jgi:hypothetical protein
MKTADVTPWFLAADDAPVRDGRYQVRFCVGWREVFCEWNHGRWYMPALPFERRQQVRMAAWPGFHWRGRREPPNV